MQETLGTTVKEAYNLLKYLHKCSTSLTMKAQLISTQLQQVSQEINDATYPVGINQLYNQAEELETKIQKIEENLATTK